MPATVTIRTDYSASELRRLSAGSKDANQSRRLLSLAAVLDGMGRADAARIGGMDRQTLRGRHRGDADASGRNLLSRRARLSR
ncbi:MAG: IS630 family transposase, partial [Rhodoblastus sp.]